MRINPPPHLEKKEILLKKKKPSKRERASGVRSLKKWGEDIFHAYDIRGIFPVEINEEVAYNIGRAFVKFLKKANPKIVVGRDNRLSSPAIFKSLIKGITDQGGNVVDIGLVITPMLYFTVAHLKCDGGVMVTASHNPPQYNGFKMVREEAIPISAKSGLKQIKALTQEIPRPVLGKAKGKIVQKKVLPDYLKFNLKRVNLKSIKSLKIVIDTANGVSGILIPELKKEMPVKIYSLFEKLDGNFPNHQPDPLKKESLISLQKEVREKKANLGVAFDGDGDRIVFVDETGKVIRGDLITALLASLTLKQNPGAKILFDVRSSQIVPEAIRNYGGKPIIWKIGHSLIKEKMRKEDILFGGEFSGHYYFKETYFSEAPLLVLFKVLEATSKAEKEISEILQSFKKYFHSGEINFKIKDKQKALKKLEDKFGQKGRVLKIDGLRIDFGDWWFLARPSGTEDLLRLVVEGKTKKIMEQRKKDLISLIKS